MADINPNNPNNGAGEFPIDSNSNLLRPGLTDDQRTEVNELLGSLTAKFDTTTENVKKDFLTFFGLFASFVAFLLIEVQIFKSRESLSELLGISILTLAFVMFFALVLNSLIKEQGDWKSFGRPAYVICYTLVFVGCILVYFGEDQLQNKIRYIETNHRADSLKLELLRLETDSLKRAIKTTTEFKNRNGKRQN